MNNAIQISIKRWLVWTWFVFFWKKMDFRNVWNKLEIKWMFIFLVCFGLYIDVSSVSMSFTDIFCIYEHILKYMFGFVRTFWTFRISNSFFTEMVLNGSPPSLSPASAKISCQGAKQQNKCLNNFYVFMKTIKTYPYRGA